MRNVELARAVRMVSDFRRDLELTPESEVNLLAQEKRVQEIANGIARELMCEVMTRADVKGPEVVIDGVRWGNGGRCRRRRSLATSVCR